MTDKVENVEELFGISSSAYKFWKSPCEQVPPTAEKIDTIMQEVYEWMNELPSGLVERPMVVSPYLYKKFKKMADE